MEHGISFMWSNPPQSSNAVMAEACLNTFNTRLIITPGWVACYYKMCHHFSGLAGITFLDVLTRPGVECVGEKSAQRDANTACWL